MRMSRLLKGTALLAIGAVLLPAAAKAAAPTPSAAPASSAVPGWTDFLDGLRDLPDRILARLPAEQRNDPQVRQEAGRLALSAVAAATIDALASDPDHPVFLPRSTITLLPGSLMRTPTIAPPRSHLAASTGCGDVAAP